MPNVVPLQKIGSLTVTAVSTNLTNGSIWVGDAANLPAEVNLTETVQDLVAALLVAGTNIVLTYNDAAGTLTIDATVSNEVIDDRVAALLVAGTGIILTYNDVANTLTVTLAAHNHTPAEITGFAEAVDDRVAALLVAGTNIVLTYDDTLNTLTIDATAAAGYTDEQAQDAIASLLVAGTGITLTYNDIANTLTIDAAAGGGSADDVKCLYNNEDLLILTNTVKVGVDDITFTGTGNLIIEGTGRLAIV